MRARSRPTATGPRTPSSTARRWTPTRPATSSARWPRRPGSAATPASSTTPRSTTGTPAPNRRRITPATRAPSSASSTTRACNLASLNLMKFRTRGRRVRRRSLPLRLPAARSPRRRSWSTTPATPRRRSRDNSHLFRPLGLGYANLGALLMSRGLAYDSPEGQAYAGAITSIMTAEAYGQSAVIARDHGGPFAEYRKNEEPFLRVIQKHRDAAHADPGQGRRPVGPAPRRARRLGRHARPWARRTAIATPRPRCSRPPAPSPS